MTFSIWLATQRSRPDDIGRFAHLALTDPTYPLKSNQLSVFLTYYSEVPELRRIVKRAHREWRAVRDGRQA